MSDDLKSRIQEDVKTAMRARDKARLGALRLVTAAIKQREIDERIDLDGAGVLAVLGKMLKQRRESLTQFNDAGRRDLADQEAFEIGIIEAYMPASLSEAEIAALIDAALAESAATTMKDMGKVMALLKPRLQGRADMGPVSASVKSRLSNT